MIGLTVSIPLGYRSSISGSGDGVRKAYFCGVSVMLVTSSKLCSVRVYSQYAFGVP